MTREDYIDEFIRHGSDLIPYNTPNYDEVLLERANKYADEMLNPDSKLGKLCEWHDSLIDNHSSDVEEQEDKQLLLRDLCARLPYGLQIHITSDECDDSFRSGEFDNTLRYHHLEAFVCDRIEIKPYLRPMSSMTEEEKKKIQALYHENTQNVFKDPDKVRGYRFYDISVVDWLNSHHFDYRGLIPMGLALEAPEGMYNSTNNA